MKEMIALYSKDQNILHRWREKLQRECRAFDNLQSLLSDTESESLELVLVHLQSISNEGNAAVDQIIGALPWARVLALSDAPQHEEGYALLKKGVAGYCNTYISGELMHKAIDVIQAGEVWVGRKLIEHLITNLAAVSRTAPSNAVLTLDELTEREREIAQMVGEGDSNKRIASRLDITERTVKAHISSIFRKTDTQDRLQLALLVNGQARRSAN
jgi:two-component system nitrate/nitrite response regulator NarL